MESRVGKDKFKTIVASINPKVAELYGLQVGDGKMVLENMEVQSRRWRGKRKHVYIGAASVIAVLALIYFIKQKIPLKLLFRKLINMLI